MASKTLMTIGMIVGFLVGGYVASLFCAGIFSFVALIGSGIGAIAGIYLAYKISRNI